MRPKFSLFSFFLSLILIFFIFYESQKASADQTILAFQLYAAFAALAFVTGVISIKQDNEYRSFSYLGVIISIILGMVTALMSQTYNIAT